VSVDLTVAAEPGMDVFDQAIAYYRPTSSTARSAGRRFVRRSGFGDLGAGHRRHQRPDLEPTLARLLPSGSTGPRYG